MAAIGNPVTVIQPLDAKDVPMSLVEKKFTQQNPQTGIRHIPAQLAQFTLDWMNRTNPGWLTTVKEKNPELAKKYEIAQSSTGNQNLVQAASGNPKPIGKVEELEPAPNAEAMSDNNEQPTAPFILGASWVDLGSDQNTLNSNSDPEKESADQKATNNSSQESGVVPDAAELKSETPPNPPAVTSNISDSTDQPASIQPTKTEKAVAKQPVKRSSLCPLLGLTAFAVAGVAYYMNIQNH